MSGHELSSPFKFCCGFVEFVSVEEDDTEIVVRGAAVEIERERLSEEFLRLGWVRLDELCGLSGELDRLARGFSIESRSIDTDAIPIGRIRSPR